MNLERPIRVLHIIDRLGMGGAETWLMEVLRLWSKNKVGQMDFLATSGGPGIFDDEAKRLGARVHYVRFTRSRLVRFAMEFRRVLRDGRYDAIHDHEDYASGWHFLIGAKFLPPIRVTHVHNPAYQIRNNYGVTRSRRLASRIGKALVAHYSTNIAGTSRQAITEYGFDNSRFHRIPKEALYCGFDSTRFLGDAISAKASICQEFGWPMNSKIILFVGRIDQSVDPDHPQNHKNSGFAVSVGIECARQAPNVRMLLAGAPSPAVTTLEKRIAIAGFEGRIKFVGVRKDIEQFMLASSVLLFPSRGEGLGMVAVEAQASGLPVLASIEVPRECIVVRDLMHFKNVQAGHAEWAADILQHAAQHRDIAKANQQVAASCFSIDNSAHALLKVYGVDPLA